jgi:hypothetical protein
MSLYLDALIDLLIATRVNQLLNVCPNAWTTHSTPFFFTFPSAEQFSAMSVSLVNSEK